MTSGRGVALFLILAALAVQSTSALNILVLAAVQTRSHFTFSNSISTALLQRGHKIFELTIQEGDQHPNRTSFIADDFIGTYDHGLDGVSQDNLFSIIFVTAWWSVHGCGLTLKSKAASDLLALARDSKRRPHIDVVVYDYVFHQCLGPFVTEFGSPPVVAISAYGNSVDIDEVIGGPLFTSFVPHDVMSYPPNKPMTWFQRLHNKVVYLWSDLVRALFQFPSMEARARKFFGENASSIAEIRERVSLALVNSHPAFHGARPQLPSVVQVGGIHLEPPRELPPGDLKDFLDGAKDGFIVISFGSVVQVSAMEPWRTKELMRALEKLRPCRALMKWELPWNDTVGGFVPDNVFISRWFPQRDVLAHPNVRLIVTHAGALSTNEILQRGVPVVAVPFFLDQFVNANLMDQMKIGRLLRYVDLREDRFYEVVQSVLKDKSYLTEVRRLSALVQDELNSPRERAVFWIEYVARHGGAPHFRSPARLLNWASRWLVDDLVVALVFGLLIGVLVRAISRRCRRSHSPRTKTKYD